MPSAPDKLSRQRLFAVAAAVAGIATIGVVDWATGPLLSLSVFYLIPTAWATVHAGRRAGLAFAALSGAVALSADVLTQPHYRHRPVAAWNAGLLFVTLVVVVELVHRVRRQAVAALDAERHSREFLAQAAHQLRTPLAGIRSTVDALLLAGDHDPDQEHLLANLSREASRAGRQISGLLRMARLDQHEPVPARQLRLAEVVRIEVDRAAAAWPALTWKLDSPDPVEVHGNPDALGEAVANLLDNAHRHARTHVTVTIRRRPTRVEVAVADDGPGLPAGTVDAAFDRFVSFDGHGGTGLGLPIARGIAHAHGGGLAWRDGAFVLSLPAE